MLCWKVRENSTQTSMVFDILPSTNASAPPTLCSSLRRCGDGTSSFTQTLATAEPRLGYADGQPYQSRFNSPRGIAVADYGDVFVADTDNHLLRVIQVRRDTRGDVRQCSPHSNANPSTYSQRNGTARTLAGTVQLAQSIGSDGYVDAQGNPMPGCEPPCYAGVPGYADGDLVNSGFHFPQHVAMAYNNTAHKNTDGKNSWSNPAGWVGSHSIYVTEQHRLRRVAFEVPTYEIAGKTETAISHLQGVRSSGRVSTIAGSLDEGERDGQGDESSFNSPSGVIVTSDDIAYVVDAVSCRLRRITPALLVAEEATCSSTVDSLIRPSGCASYDPPVDELDLKASPSNGNTYDNYADRDISDVEFGVDYIGRMIKDCVGTPPVDKLDKKF